MRLHKMETIKKLKFFSNKKCIFIIPLRKIFIWSFFSFRQLSIRLSFRKTIYFFSLFRTEKRSKLITKIKDRETCYSRKTTEQKYICGKKKQIKSQRKKFCSEEYWSSEEIKKLWIYKFRGMSFQIKLISSLVRRLFCYIELFIHLFEVRYCTWVLDFFFFV